MGGLRGRWSSASPLLRRLGKLVAAVSMVGALAGVYEGVAPADWVRPSYLWAVPRPVVTQLTVAMRCGVCDARDFDKDEIDVTALGGPMPAALRLRELRLVAFWRLPQSLTWYAWHVSESDGRVDVKDARECIGENWEFEINGIRCEEDYSGDVQVVLALMPEDALEEYHDSWIAANRKDGTWELPAEAFVTSGNIRSCASPGPTPGSRPSPYRQVARLSVYASVQRFREVLGPEAMRTTLGDSNGLHVTEYLFYTEDLAVRAISDRDDSVVFYAVTTMSPDFFPAIPYWDENVERAEVCLGRTRFEELPQPESIYAWGDELTNSYYEVYSDGYQTITFSNSDANAQYEYGPAPEGFWSAGGEIDSSDQGVGVFRQQTVVDTVGFIAPYVSVADLQQTGVMEPTGADKDLLSVLPDFDWGVTSPSRPRHP